MREIKFRGKRVDNGEWVYGYLGEQDQEYDDGISELVIGIYDNDGMVFNQVFEKTVGQYTGIKDKNGVEIYEGDIVAFYDELKMEKTHISKIIFNQEKSRFDKELLKKYFGESEKNGISSNWATVVEVIGNVYENPELLKETI